LILIVIFEIIYLILTFDLMNNFNENNFAWAKELNLAITVSDLEDNVIYMNDKSKTTFPNTNIGDNLQNCHQKSSNETIQNLRDENISNTYTVEKNGVRKLIHQTPWYSDGKVAGLVELSIELPNEMEHKIRKS